MTGNSRIHRAPNGPIENFVRLVGHSEKGRAVQASVVEVAGTISDYIGTANLPRRQFSAGISSTTAITLSGEFEALSAI